MNEGAKYDAAVHTLANIRKIGAIPDSVGIVDAVEAMTPTEMKDALLAIFLTGLLRK